MPKFILLKNIFLIFLLLCISWLTYSQTIVITKDGPGICPNGSITLSTSDVSLVSYKWEILRNTGWSAVPYADNATLNTTEIGTYHLLAVDKSGISRTSNQLNIVGLSSPPIPVITPSRTVTQICQGDSIILKTTFQTGFQYFWFFDNVQMSIPQSVQIVAKKAGTYELGITDQSPTSNGCSAKSIPYKLDYTSIIIVKLDSVPPFCSLSDPPINLIVTPTGGQFKGKGITDTNNGTFNPSTAGVGKHEIRYEITQNGSCPSLIEKRIISVADLKPMITTNTGKFQFCQGNLATLSAAPVGMKKYQWFLAGNAVSTLEKLEVGADGDFRVKITDSEGCIATSPMVKIEFFKTVSVTIDSIPSVCGIDYPSIPLKGSPSGGVFTIDGVFDTTFDYKKLGFGKHKILYQLDGSLPCLKGSSEQEVFIQDFPKPDLGPDILLGKGNNIILKGFIDQSMTYSWSPASGLDNPASANPVASPAQTTEYMLTVTSSGGCKGVGKVNIVVYQPIYIPTAFTPNADGINDFWELKGLEVYPNPEVQIYNRWGNIVFYSKGGYSPFDGTDSNKALPEGMYIYKISPFPDRLEFQYKGTFMLLR